MSEAIASINPETDGHIEGAAWLLATGRVKTVVITHGIRPGCIRIVEENGEQHELRLNSKLPMLLNLGLRTDCLTERVALGMSNEAGERINWDTTIRELRNPAGTLALLLPATTDARINYVADLLRGRIQDAEERIAAYRATSNIPIDEFQHAHLPPSIRRHQRRFLYARGALVATFADGEAMGVHLSKRAQKLGLDCRDFNGLPEHWWAENYGSSKAPRPYDEAGITADELQAIVRDNLARLLPQNQEAEEE